MSEAKLFSVPKVAIFLDSYKPAKEKRREETVTVINATFRVHPFDAKLATAIDDGLNAGVRPLLFNLNNVEPKAIIGGTDLNLDCPRQNMEMFAAPDTDESSIVFLQVKITKPKAVEHKDVSGFALTFHGTFGPVDRDTLMYLQGWYGTQRFVTFQESEPSLDFSDEELDDEDDDGVRAPAHAPMFDDEEAAQAPSAGVEAAKANTSERKREKGHRYTRRHSDRKSAKTATGKRT